MRLGGGDDLSNVEDRRGQSGGGGRGVGLRLGLGGTVVVLLLSLIFKRNFFAELEGGGNPAGPAQPSPARVHNEEPLKQVAVGSFNDAQKFWHSELHGGRAYRESKLVLFWDETRSGCGGADAQMGPFYCPADERVYIDLGFYEELKSRFGAPGDFAQAYVIAHEIGHHVQNVLGIERKMRADQERNPRMRNALSVKLELQADCFAGLWGRSTKSRGLLDPGDIDEGLAAAAAVGDDRLQKASNRRVSPETWTHGSSAQRTKWFRRGFDSGDPEQCDTFAAPDL